MTTVVSHAACKDEFRGKRFRSHSSFFFGFFFTFQIYDLDLGAIVLVLSLSHPFPTTKAIHVLLQLL